VHRGSVKKLDDAQSQLLGDMMKSMDDPEGLKKVLSSTDEMY